MAHSNVPKFGNWKTEENDVPYTVFFDKARKNKGGKMINPNDPQENPDMFRNFAPSPLPPASVSASTSKPRTRPDKPVGRGALGPTLDHRMSKEEGDYRKFTNSLVRSENLGRKTVNESTQQNYGGSGTRYGRPARSSAGSEHSIDRSPLHPHYQAKIVEGGSGSPAQEGKNSYDSSHGNPGRSRLKPAIRGAVSPDRGAAVPKFGEWDEKDPQSAKISPAFLTKYEKKSIRGLEMSRPLQSINLTSHIIINQKRNLRNAAFHGGRARRLHISFDFWSSKIQNYSAERKKFKKRWDSLLF